MTANQPVPSGETLPQAMGIRKWIGLFFVALGVSMIIVDATIVNVSIPSIIDDLGITSSQAQWVQEAYTLVFAAFLLMFGRLADRWGRRRIFLIGVVIFVLASVLAASSQSGGALIGARLIQGLGGAMMLPTSLSLINAGFRGKDRAIAFAIWGSTIGGTAALGPLLGGWLTTDFSWRWAFGINVPLGLAVFIGARIFVKESTGDREEGIDVVGALLSVAGIGLLVFGLIEGRNLGWWESISSPTIAGWQWSLGISIVPVAFLIGVLALIAFALLEVRRNRTGKAVLLDLSLFSLSSFRNGNIAVAIVSLGEFGLLFALPLWLQNVLGYTAFKTGQVLLALALGSFLAAGFGARLAQQRGAIFVVRIGIALEIVGILGIGVVASPTANIWPVIMLLFFYGMGVGLATAQLTGVVLVDVPVASSGQGSGIQSTMRQLGSALGIAILGTVLFTGLGSQLNKSLADNPQISAEQRQQSVDVVVATAGSVIPKLSENPQTEPVATAAKEAFSTATKWAAFVAAGFLVLGLLASLSLGASKPMTDPAD